jgi:hypothetical protein
LYFILLLLPLGILEITDIPIMVSYGLAAWIPLDVSSLVSVTVFGRHIVAIIVSLLLLPRFRRLILTRLESNSPDKQATAHIKAQ